MYHLPSLEHDRLWKRHGTLDIFCGYARKHDIVHMFAWVDSINLRNISSLKISLGLILPPSLSLSLSLSLIILFIFFFTISLFHPPITTTSATRNSPPPPR